MVIWSYFEYTLIIPVWMRPFASMPSRKWWEWVRSRLRIWCEQPHPKHSGVHRKSDAGKRWCHRIKSHNAVMHRLGKSEVWYQTSTTLQPARSSELTYCKWIIIHDIKSYSAIVFRTVRPQTHPKHLLKANPSIQNVSSFLLTFRLRALLQKPTIDTVILFGGKCVSQDM